MTPFEEVPMPLETLSPGIFKANLAMFPDPAGKYVRLSDALALRNAALEEAAKLRKLIADHNAECVRMCDSRFAYGPTQCPMRAYNRQCGDCPKDGMVEVPALKKENGDADRTT